MCGVVYESLKKKNGKKAKKERGGGGRRKSFPDNLFGQAVRQTDRQEFPVNSPVQISTG